jgi:hypothetical protein
MRFTFDNDVPFALVPVPGRCGWWAFINRGYRPLGDGLDGFWHQLADVTYPEEAQFQLRNFGPAGQRKLAINGETFYAGAVLLRERSEGLADWNDFYQRMNWIAEHIK